jgi:signal transduction histidine kinase
VVDGGGEVGGVERPQPTLADLPDLAEQSRAGGPVELRDELHGADPPDWLGRQAYRIVQESLTNARKHAAGAAVTVGLAGRPGEQLVIEVVNERARPREGAEVPVRGAGLGLVGLAERAGATGGTLEHGPRPGGGYVVRACLPWPAGANGTGDG